jgi:hypothetical protein
LKLKKNKKILNFFKSAFETQKQIGPLREVWKYSEMFFLKYILLKNINK